MEKFRGKYRIPTARLQTWDYGSNALYFITICTKNRKHFFGEIANGQMILSEIGRLAEKYWYEIPEHFPFVILDEFVVMPNHIHGIIEIAKTNDATETNDAVNNVETQNFASLQPPPPPPPPPDSFHKNKFGPQSENLASIVRGYKIGVTTNARKIQADFAWQPRFHDHIIRNSQAYQNIKNYIANNPQKWADDTFNAI